MKPSYITQYAQRLWLVRNRRLQAVFLALAALLLAAALVFLALVRPLSRDLEGQRQRIAGMRRDISSAVLFEQQQKSVGAISTAVLTQKDMPLLVKELAQKARTAGLSVGSVDYEIPRSGGGGLARLVFQFPVAGRYPDLKRFIFELETSSRMLGIEELQLKSGRTKVDLDLKLVTYVRG